MASSQGIEQLRAFNHKVIQPQHLGDYFPPGKLAEGDEEHGYCNLENCNKNFLYHGKHRKVKYSQ